MHSMSTTSDAESDEVAKKIATTSTASPCISGAQGSSAKNANIASGTDSLTALLMLPAAGPIAARAASPSPSMAIACQPKIANQMTVNSDGASRTPKTNSRTVRPREIRATNRPMKGDQVTVQAQ